MKLFSNTALALCTAGILLTTISMANATNNTNTDQRITYTATGKTNVKTVRLFQQLLKNSHNLTVTSKITRRPKQQITYSTQPNRFKPPVDYTVTGKTSRKNVRKLMELFSNNKNIEMVIEANAASSNKKRVARFTINNTGLYKQNHAFSQYQPVYSRYYTRYVPYYVWRVTEQFNGYPMPAKGQVYQQQNNHLQHNTQNNQAPKNKDTMILTII